MRVFTLGTNLINNLNKLFAQLLQNINVVENECKELLLHSLIYSYDQLIINITNNNIDEQLHFLSYLMKNPSENSKLKLKVLSKSVAVADPIMQYRNGGLTMKYNTR